MSETKRANTVYYAENWISKLDWKGLGRTLTILMLTRQANGKALKLRADVCNAMWLYALKMSALNLIISLKSYHRMPIQY
jgi:hypothetical protein